MTKTLYILRHAKSEWPDGVDDKDRPLGDRGRRAAAAVAARMAQDGYRPALVLCSPARRTRQTFAPIREHWPDLRAEYPDHLYLASTGDLYETLKSVGDDYDSVLIIGHNPGFHGLAQFLIGEGDPADLAQIQGNYKTGCLSVVACSCESWAALAPGENRLVALFVGKELAGPG